MSQRRLASSKLATRFTLTSLAVSAALAGMLAFVPLTRDKLAHAYQINAPWPSANATLRLHDLSFPSASPELNAVINAKDKWNLNPSNFRFSLVFNDTDVDLGNGQNEIWSVSNLGRPSKTYPIYDSVTGNLVEADILVDQNKCWAFNPTSYTTLEGYGTNCRLMEATLIHEMGHALGLHHENDEYNVMGHAWQHVHVNLSTADAYVGEDASDGAVALYGLSASAGEDVSVSHWKYDSAATGSDEYSHHRRVELYDTLGRPLLLGTPEYEGFRYLVAPGQTLSVEFTYENNGRSLQSPGVRLVCSNDNWITKFDTVLDDRQPTLNRSDVYTHRYTVTLPSTLAPGDKYIGVVIDPDNLITEVDETNNATWVPIHVI